MERGINCKKYYQLFVNLDNGKTAEFTKSEYRKMIFDMLIVMICNKSIPCCGCSKMETCTLGKL